MMHGPVMVVVGVQMGAHSLEGNLHLPAPQEPAEEGVGLNPRVGAQRDLRAMEASRVPQQLAPGAPALSRLIPEFLVRLIVQFL